MKLRHRRKGRRDRGVTLIELLISLTVIVVGMLAVFRVLSTSIKGGMNSSHVAQAQQRAETIIEAIRLAPTQAITCLTTTPAAGWSACEATCLQYQTIPLTAVASTCIFTMNSFLNVNGPPSPTAGLFGEQGDRQGQQYFINSAAAVPTGQFLPAVYGTTYVRMAGYALRTAEIAISVAWNDDNSLTATGVVAGVPFPNHSITLISGVVQ